MNYWISLFTGTTWAEFRSAGASTSGYSQRRTRTIERIHRGDVLLCYVTGTMRWVGALKVVGPIKDDTRIWHERDFPVRLQVKPELLLDPEQGVPMRQLEGRVSFYHDTSDRQSLHGVVRGSPTLLRDTSDGEKILQMLRQQQVHPVSRPIDLEKLKKGQ